MQLRLCHIQVSCTGSGDVAEHYLRRDWQTRCEPYAEGDVVGIIGKQISLSTKSCHMAGIVSTRAMIEGLQPSDRDERWKYSAVAIAGQVPVKIRGMLPS